MDYAISVGVASPFDALSPAESDVALVDAFSRLTVPSGNYTSSLALGIQRVPFHREGLMSSVDLLFQERSVGGDGLSPGVRPAPCWASDCSSVVKTARCGSVEVSTTATDVGTATRTPG